MWWTNSIYQVRHGALAKLLIAPCIEPLSFPSFGSQPLYAGLQLR